MGKIKTKFPLEVEWVVCQMCIENLDKDYDKSLYPVKQLVSKCHFCGLSKAYAKKIYDYVMYQQPYGSYISGSMKSDWEDDYFVLPSAYNDDGIWIERAQYLLNKLKEI